MVKSKKAKISFEKDEVIAAEAARVQKADDDVFEPESIPTPTYPGMEPATGQPEPSNGLVVEDLSSIEYGKLREDLVRVTEHVRAGVLYQSIFFDREDLFERFKDGKTGALSLQKVEASEWYKGYLGRNGFTDPYLFEKDKKGRTLLLDGDKDGYRITRRVPR